MKSSQSDQVRTYSQDTVAEGCQCKSALVEGNLMLLCSLKTELFPGIFLLADILLGVWVATNLFLFHQISVFFFFIPTALQQNMLHLRSFLF